MIEQVFLMRCDGCSLAFGDEPDDDEFAGQAHIFSTGEQAWEMARSAGWSTTGHRHYCPECWQVKSKGGVPRAVRA